MKQVASYLLSAFAVALLAACGGHAPDPHAAEHAAMMKADSAEKARVAAQEATARTVFEMFNTGDLTDLEKYAMADSRITRCRRRSPAPACKPRAI